MKKPATQRPAMLVHSDPARYVVVRNSASDPTINPTATCQRRSRNRSELHPISRIATAPNANGGSVYQPIWAIEVTPSSRTKVGSQKVKVYTAHAQQK